MDFVSTTTLTQFAQSTLCLHSQHCVYTVHTVSTQSTLCLHSQRQCGHIIEICLFSNNKTQQNVIRLFLIT